MKYVFAILTLLTPVLVGAQVVHDHLFSNMNGTITLADGSTTNYWGFGRYNMGDPPFLTLPGPILRYNLNDSVTIHYLNTDVDEHTIHLHGLDVDQANDGVPFTSLAIAGGDSATYSFRATHAGVYLYHCHVGTVFHIPMGMYGLILVDAPDGSVYPGGPGFNREYSFLNSEMDRSWNDDPSDPGFFYDYDPDIFLINGLSDQQLFEDSSEVINAQTGDSLLLRLANIGYSMVEYCFPASLEATAVLSDGRVIPDQALQMDTLQLFPGERYSLSVRALSNDSAHITVNVYDALLNNIVHTNYIGVNTFSFPVGITTNDSNGFTVHPNPATDYLQIVRKSSLPTEYSIWDLRGRKVANGNLFGRSTQLPIASLIVGGYILQIEGSSRHFMKR